MQKSRKIYIHIYFKTNTTAHTRSTQQGAGVGITAGRTCSAQKSMGSIWNRSNFMFHVWQPPIDVPTSCVPFPLTHGPSPSLSLCLCVCVSVWECVWHARRTVCVDVVKAESCLWRQRFHLHITYLCRPEYPTAFSLPPPPSSSCFSTLPCLQWGMRMGVGCLFDLQIVNWHSMIFDFENWMMAAFTSVWRGWLEKLWMNLHRR